MIERFSRRAWGDGNPHCLTTDRFVRTRRPGASASDQGIAIAGIRKASARLSVLEQDQPFDGTAVIGMNTELGMVAGIPSAEKRWRFDLHIKAFAIKGGIEPGHELAVTIV